ncbi:MAG: serine/threonine-protein kinase [Kiritimatiellia bacterium]
MMTFDELRSHFNEITQLARGGQKVVWQATHAQYGKTVIKLYFSVDARAEREIAISKTLCFDKVPGIYETGTVSYEGQETLYVVEQFIDGCTLRSYLNSGKLFDICVAVSFLEQGFSFVRQLEKNQIVHRDIKPENLILTNDRLVYFLDFGIARMLDMQSLTQSDAAFGPHTPGYAAPEQFNNLKRDIDSRTDLFSLGVVTYECLTGRNPFRENAASALDILQRTATVTPASYQIKGDDQHLLMGLISSMMGKNPSMRPKDATQAIDWLNVIKPTLKY